MRKINPNTFIIYFIIVTIPLLYGSIQPLVDGLYTTIIFLVSGIWLVVNYQTINVKRISPLPVLFLLLLGYVVMTAIPLPIDIVKLISPARAESLYTVLHLNQLKDITTSLSYYITGSLRYAIYGLAYLLYYYYASEQLRIKKNQDVVLWLITIVGSLEAVYAIFQAIFPAMGVLLLQGNISSGIHGKGTFLYHNQFAAFLNLCWPMAFILGLSYAQELIDRIEVIKIKKKKLQLTDRLSLLYNKTMIPFLCTGIIILGVLFSGSTSGIVTMALLILFLLILVPFGRNRKIIISFSLLLIVISASFISGIQNVINFFTGLQNTAIEQFNSWAANTHILSDHFISGIGMGAYGLLAPVYVQNIPDKIWFAHVQNGYLELTIELGVPVMILFLVWLLWGLVRYWKIIAKMPSKPELMTSDDIVVIGAFCAILGFLINAFVDFVWYLPANIFYAVTLLTVLNAAATREKTIKHHQPESLLRTRKPGRYIPYRGPRQPVKKPVKPTFNKT